MACPDDNALVGFVHRSIPSAALAEVEAHLASCDVCRAVVADLAQGLEPAAEQQPTTVGLRTNRPATLLEAGARVGRYVVVRRLGAGGMGVVYEATDPDLVRSVALKLVRWDLADGGLGDGRARMMREAQTMARLAHPNVVSLYDVGTHDGQVFLAMEFVPGRTLGQWLASKPSRGQVLEVFRQAGEGLAAAHDAGLVHRDFKPANVLVSDDGRVRVTDFGLARAAETPLPMTSGALPRVGLESITRTGAVAGTPAYMAPELLAGGLADPRSDQFAFCVALYEALAGTRPFEGDTLAELHASVLAEVIRPPVVEGALTPEVRRVVLRGFRAEPRERYPSMRALLVDLQTKPSRPRWPLAVGVLVVVAGVVGVSALRQEPGPVRAEVQTPRGPDVVPATTLPERPAPPLAPSPPPPETKPTPAAPRERSGPPRVTSKKKTGEGFLSLHVAPWGEAAVDGKALSSANMMDYVVPLPAGRHEVVLKHPQLGTRTDVIVIEPGKTLERRINLR